MLLPLIEGNRYELKKYDKKGSLESYKILRIGKIQKDNQDFRVEIIAYNYNDKVTPQDSVRTRLECSNSAENMVMSILAFLANSGDGRVKLEITSNEELFPSELSKNKKLKDVYMEIKVEEGVLSFFGAKSKIAIRNRKLNLMNPPDLESKKAERYRLTSKLLIKVYALGITFKNIVYNVEEVVDIDKGLVSQVLKQSNGSYFDVKLIDDCMN
jgi:hypothetical protein